MITKPASRCLLALAALAALAACGGSNKSNAPPAQPTPPPGDPSPASGEASCQAAVDALFAVTAAQEAPDLRARAAKVFVHRCEADRWAAELRSCMVAVKAPEDSDRCEAMMTPEQQKELRAELAKELDAAGVPAETQSGKPRPAATKAAPNAAAPKAMDASPKADAAKKSEKPAKKARAKGAPGGGEADPCEGGE